jgi:flagellar biosynthesis/type III secretory pathway M-ring protein FliF/YscJ
MDPVFWEMVKAFGPWCVPTVLLWILIREQRSELSKEREQNAKNLQADRDQQAATFDKLLVRNDANLVRHWEELGKLRNAFELAKCRYDGQCGFKTAGPTPNYPNSQGPIGERK